MAQNITLVSGSPLVGNPIFFRVTAANLSNVESLTFHRVKMSVAIEVPSIGLSKTYLLSEPVASEGENVTVDLDISSALRAIADSYEYEPHKVAGNKSYPIIAAHVEAWDEYMSDGQIRITPHIEIQGYYNFLLGGFTDFERLTSGVTKGVAALTRKPLTGEVVPADGKVYVYVPSYTYSDDDWSSQGTPPTPITTAIITSALSHGVNTLAGRDVYIVPNDLVYVPFQFVNGFGVIESIYALCYPEESVTKTVKEYDVTIPAAFNKVDRNVVRKPSSRHQLKMSSGPVTLEWQKWWQEEFLNTPHAWMYYKNTWVPVSIVPDDDTFGIDMANADIPEVQFTVKMNFEGS